MNVCRTDQLDLSTVWCSVCRTDRLDLSTVWCSVCNALNFLLVHFISELVPNLCLCVGSAASTLGCASAEPSTALMAWFLTWGTSSSTRAGAFVKQTATWLNGGMSYLHAQKQTGENISQTQSGGGGGILFLCKEFGELSVWQTLLLAKWIKEEPKEDSIVKAQSWEPLETCGIFCSSKQPLLWSLTRQAFVLL